MAQLSEFVFNNIWLCIGFGLLILIVGDELLGVTRNLLGDGEEELTKAAREQARAEAEDPVDPLDHLGEYDERGASINDIIGKR